MKIITYYLPQFHEISENNEWWGKGFTEWVNVKKAKPLFEGHVQPRIPLNNNYYDLSEYETLKWQIGLAKKYHIWGFCFYHYWFGSKLLLQKPMEMLLEHKELDFPFCISWANENWTNQWVSKDPQILVEQEYGDQTEWKRHFEYLLPFFKDSRYIKHDNKPVVVIYKPGNFPAINDMIEYWENLAKDAGFSGICFMSQVSYQMDRSPSSYKKMSYLLAYEPSAEFVRRTESKSTAIKELKAGIKKIAGKLGIELEGKKLGGLTKFDYREICECITSREPQDDREVPGFFKNWDNTPRKGIKGTVLTNVSSDIFKEYLQKQVQRNKEIYHKDFMFFFAWNEWAEGGFLEPDEADGYQYLEAIDEVLKELDEIPERDYCL